MSNKVLEHIATKYNSVKEGVKASMGGKVLEKLMENERSQDVIKVTQDREYRNKLYKEYLIS